MPATREAVACTVPADAELITVLLCEYGADTSGVEGYVTICSLARLHLTHLKLGFSELIDGRSCFASILLRSLHVT